jgi:hypothetical protein
MPRNVAMGQSLQDPFSADVRYASNRDLEGISATCSGGPREGTAAVGYYYSAIGPGFGLIAPRGLAARLRNGASDRPFAPLIWIKTEYRSTSYSFGGGGITME